MKRIKLLFAAFAAMLALTAQAGAGWTAPGTPAGVDPVSGGVYKIRNVEGNAYLHGGTAWFGWSTSAILTADINSAYEWTITGDDASGYTFACNRSGNNKLFTSGNDNPEQCMHVDGGSATKYFIEKQASGYYRLRQDGVEGKFVGGPDGKNGVLAQVVPGTYGENCCEWEFISVAALVTYGPTITYAEWRTKVLAFAGATDKYTDAGGAADALRNAVYDQDDVVDAATTADEVNAAIDAIKALVKPFLKAVTLKNGSSFNVTDFTMTNPGFELGNMNGWTNAGSQSLGAQGNKAYDNTKGNFYAERWHTDGTIDLSQVVTELPAGYYRVAGYLSTGGAPAGTFSANDAETTFQASAQYSVITKLAEDGDITVRVTGNVTGSTWFCVDEFSIEYLGGEENCLVILKPEVEAAATDAKTQIDALDISATAKTHFKNSVDEAVASATAVATCAAAKTAIDAALAAAKALVYPYNHYKIVSAAATALDDDPAAFTGDATIDVTAVDAEVEEVTDEAGINAAILKVQAVVNEFLDAVTLNDGYRFDITKVYLENPDFNRDYVNPIPGKLSMPKGWEITITGENCGQQNRTDTNPETSLAITDFIEAWHPSQLGSGVIAQKVSVLPEGVYVLECDASVCHDPAGADDIVGASLFIKSSLKTERQAISNVRLYIKHYSLSFIHGGDGEVQFGLENDNSNANWLSADNFKVYYAGPMPLENYDALLQSSLDEAYLLLDELEGAVPAAALEKLQGVIDTNDKIWSSKDEYRAAIAAINTAMDDTKALVSPYAGLQNYKDEFKALAAVENDNAEANATFKDAIENAGEDATTKEEIAAAKETLAAARLTYVAEANPTGDGQFDLTFMLTNPDLTGLPSAQKADGWYNDQTQPTQNSQVMSTNEAVANTADPTKYAMYEYWSSGTEATEGFVVYQKVTLTPGTYKMQALCFAGYGGGHRYGKGTDDGGNPGSVSGEGVEAISFSANEVDGTYIHTTTLEDANLEFVNAIEQEVKIGLKAHAGNQSNWMGIGYVQFFKVAPKTIEIAENVEFVPESAAGKVKLTRTIKADTWNTFVVPFQITNEELKAAFGDDVEVAEESEKVVNDGFSTICFNKMETPAIAPNKPVLLKTSTAGTVYEFENRTVAAGANDVVGTNFDFVGTYKPGKVAAGDYLIGSNKLFLSDGTTNIAGTHAYLKAKAAEVKAELFIDGVATAIESIDAENAQPGAIYNVAGQRVQKAQRGLYIMGGKKVMVK